MNNNNFFQHHRKFNFKKVKCAVKQWKICVYVGEKAEKDYFRTMKRDRDKNTKMNFLLNHQENIFKLKRCEIAKKEENL